MHEFQPCECCLQLLNFHPIFHTSFWNLHRQSLDVMKETGLNLVHSPQPWLYTKILWSQTTTIDPTEESELAFHFLTKFVNKKIGSFFAFSSVKFD